MTNFVGMKAFAPLNLPPASLRLRPCGEDDEVFDPLRGKWVRLTPEEWVRQHFVHFLIENRGVPRSLTANEKGIKLNGTLKRCDTVVFTRDLQPLAIIEYKAPDVPITQKVFEQIVRYNIVLRSRYLIVSNGLCHYCCKVDPLSLKCSLLSDIPAYSEMVGNL